MTLDGKVATSTGDSQWISGEAEPRPRPPLARRAGRRGRRHRHRAGRRPAAHRARRGRVRASRARVVFDSEARLPLDRSLVRDRGELGDRSSAPRAAKRGTIAALEAAGVEVDGGHRARTSRRRVRAALDRARRARDPVAPARGRSAPRGRVLRRRRDRRGARCSWRPILAGGREARAPVEGQGIETIGLAVRALHTEVERVEDDVLISARHEGVVRCSRGWSRREAGHAAVARDADGGV